MASMAAVGSLASAPPPNPAPPPPAQGPAERYTGEDVESNEEEEEENEVEEFRTRSTRRESWVWRLFSIYENVPKARANLVRCNQCEVVLSRRRPGAYSFGTTTMKQHLTSFHTADIRKVVPCEERSRLSSSTASSESDPPTTRDTPVGERLPPAASQAICNTVETYFSKVKIVCMYCDVVLCRGENFLSAFEAAVTEHQKICSLPK